MSGIQLDQIMDKLNIMEQCMATKEDLQLLRKELLGEMDSRFKKVDERFNGVDERFNEVDERFKEVHANFKRVDVRFKEVNEELRIIREQVAHNSEFEPTIRELKMRVDDHDNDLKFVKRELNRLL